MINPLIKIFLIFTAINGQFFAQTTLQQTVDSLEQVILQTTDERKKIDLIVDLAFDYKEVAPLKGLEAAKKGLELSRKIGYKEGEAEALNAIGSNYSILSEYDKSIDYYLQAQKIAVEIKNERIESNTLNHIGLFYYWRGRYDESLKYLLGALKIREKLGDLLRLASTTNNVGLVYYQTKEYNLALDYFNRSLKIKEEIADYSGVVRTLTNIALCKRYLNRKEEAIDVLYRAIDLSKKLDYKAGIALSFDYIGNIHLSEGRYQTALVYMFSSSKVYKELNSKHGLIYNYMSISDAYRGINKLDSALYYSQKGIELSKEIQTSSFLVDLYDRMSMIYKDKKDFHNALSYRDSSVIARDTVLSKERSKILLELQSDYRIEQKEQEILNMEREIRNQNRLLVLVIIILVITLIAAFIIFRINLKKKKIIAELEKASNQLQKYAKEQEEMNATKDKFFSIIAHDLKAPFQGLVGYTTIIKDGIDTMPRAELSRFIDGINEITRSTYGLLENLLEWSRIQTNKIIVSPVAFDIGQEIDKSVKVLEGKAKEKRIDVQNHVSKDVKVLCDKNMFKTVVHNLISNALKFTMPGGKIAIKSEINSNEVIISVKDSGIGIPAEDIDKLFRIDQPVTTKGTGLGLVICKEMVEKNGGEIWVTSEENEGSIFYFTIPSM
ncbi:MAG: tetratricopeptide repeat-containing sensor histidine kinase [Bacteroidetes bacterium]|nr:tetratricopeptide repeat-containing sensor histidine kinase [Bacteroidota bacterium]